MAGIFLSVLWIIQSLRFVNVIVNRNVSFWNYFKLIALLIPDIITIILPFCILVTGLWVYYKLVINHEMIVLQNMGRSSTQIALPFLTMGFLGMIFSLIVSFWVLPASLRYFKDQRYTVHHHLLSLLIQDGMFYSLKNSTIYVEKNLSDRFEHVFVYSNRPQKKNTIFAQKAIMFNQTEHSVILQLINGTIFQEQGNTLTQLHFKTLNYQVDWSVPVRSQSLSEKNTYSLLFPESNLPLDIQTKMKIEGHKRILLPCLVMLNALLVSCFMLRFKGGRQFPKRQIVYSLASGFFVSFLFYESLCLATHHANLILYAYMALFISFVGLCLKLQRV